MLITTIIRVDVSKVTHVYRVVVSTTRTIPRRRDFVSHNRQILPVWRLWRRSRAVPRVLMPRYRSATDRRRRGHQCCSQSSLMSGAGEDDDTTVCRRRRRSDHVTDFWTLTGIFDVVTMIKTRDDDDDGAAAVPVSGGVPWCTADEPPSPRWLRRDKEASVRRGKKKKKHPGARARLRQ